MPLDLILPTAITTVVGILVKSLFDMLKKYVDASTEWRRSIDQKLDAQAAKTDTLMDATQTTMRAQREKISSNASRHTSWLSRATSCRQTRSATKRICLHWVSTG